MIGVGFTIRGPMGKFARGLSSRSNFAAVGSRPEGLRCPDGLSRNKHLAGDCNDVFCLVQRPLSINPTQLRSPNVT